MYPWSACLRQAATSPGAPTCTQGHTLQAILMTSHSQDTPSLLKLSSRKGTPRSRPKELTLVAAESMQANGQRGRDQLSLGTGPFKDSGALSLAIHSGEPCSGLRKMRASLEAPLGLTVNLKISRKDGSGAGVCTVSGSTSYRLHALPQIPLDRPKSEGFH